MAQMTTEQFTADVKAARNGDADAFGRLYATVYRELFHVAKASLRSSEDAADAVSDAVLDAFRTIGKLRDEAAFRAWMFKILSAKIKQKQREYAKAADALDETNSPACEFGFAAPEVREALRQLNDEDRLLFSMQVLGGYQSRELAEMLGSTDGAIRTRLTRIRAKLREALTDTTAVNQGREEYAV